MPDDRLRVLLVEDNNADADVIRDYLTRTGDEPCLIDRAMTLTETEKFLTSAAPDVVLLNLDLPDSRGLATLTALCDPALQRPQPPIVVLADSDADAVNATQVMASCAQDCLVKGTVTPASLMQAIRFAIQRHGRERIAQIPARPSPVEAQEAMGVIQRVNRLAPEPVPRPSSRSITPSEDRAGLFRERVVTSGRAVAVVLESLRERCEELEARITARDIIEARDEGTIEQLRHLVHGNGKGPLAARLDAAERDITQLSTELKVLRAGRSQFLIGLLLLLVAALAIGVVYVIHQILTH